MIDNIDEEDWIYEVLDQNMQASDFGPFASLATLWRSKWVGGALPTWRDFEIEDLDGWHGRLIVEDVIPGGNGDVRFRLWGTIVAELFQRDLTGKCMSELKDWFDPQEFDLVTRIVEEGVIVRSTGSLAWEGRGYRKISTMEFPLAKDGKTIDQILCGVCLVE